MTEPTELETLRAQLRTAEEARERAERAFALQPMTDLQNEGFREALRSQLIREGFTAAAQRDQSRADLAAISALFPDNAPHKFPETGVSLLDDVRDALGEVYQLKQAAKYEADVIEFAEHGERAYKPCPDCSATQTATEQPRIWRVRNAQGSVHIVANGSEFESRRWSRGTSETLVYSTDNGETWVEEQLAGESGEIAAKGDA